MASNTCWGVEVGAGSVKGVKLVRDGDDVKVVDFAIVPHKRVLSTPETNERDAKVVAIGQLLAHADVTKSPVAISIPGHSAFAKFAKLPPADPKQIPALVKFEAAQQIPFPIDEVEWDYQTFATPDSPDVEAGIFAVTREKVMDVLSLWTDLKCTPEALTLSPLAAYNALAFDQVLTEKSPGMVIVDIGTISTDLIVADAGRLWIRTFPIGGHQFTEALVTAFNLSYVKAEKLKREAESSQHARHILQAMRPVFADLAQDVQRSMTYYQSLHPEAKLTKVVGLGATFNLPGLRKFLSQQLGVEVGRLENFSRAKMSGERDKEFQANAMLLSTAYGLALQGLGLNTVQANLMPAAVVRENMWEAKTRWFVTAAVLAVAAGGAAFIGPLRDSSAASTANKPPVIEEVKSLAKSLKNSWTQAQGENKPDYRAAASLALLEDREMYGKLLNDVTGFVDRLQTEVAKNGKNAKVAFRTVDLEYLVMGQKPSAAGAGKGPGVGRDAPTTDPNNPTELNPRIGIVLNIDTTLPEDRHQAVLRDLANKWIREMNARKDMGYAYDTNVVLTQLGKELIQGPVGGGPTLPTPGGVGGPGRIPGVGPGGGVPEIPPPGAMQMGGSSGPSEKDLETMAPIPPTPPLADTNVEKHTKQFVLYANLIRPTGEKKEGGQ